MVNQAMWVSFVNGLHAQQDELREYLAGFENGTIHDPTGRQAAAIKEEIASLQATIDRVIVREGLPK